MYDFPSFKTTVIIIKGNCNIAQPQIPQTSSHDKEDQNRPSKPAEVLKNSLSVDLRHQI